MAIGTTAAIIGSAVIGAGASAISSKNSSKAVNNATTAQITANRESLAVQQQVREENKGILNPFVQSGYGANNALSALLGTGGGGSGAYDEAFKRYRDGTGYNFRVGEGMGALKANFAGSGTINSGAAAKAAINYGQNMASAEFGNYMGQLTQQQQMGLAAGNALAGVGTNFANNATNINTSTGSAIGNGALAQQSVNNQMMNNISGIAGNAIGQLSSYGAFGPSANQRSMSMIAKNSGIF